MKELLLKNTSVFILALTLISFDYPKNWYIIGCQPEIHNIEFNADADQYINYTWPTDSTYLNRINDWQDLKFGLMMHWGAYSQWAVVESWTLCPEDFEWNQRKLDTNDNYFEYKKNYENLKKTFNPSEFNPKKWADAADNAGMKYMVFTAKHHDGFAMWDSKVTDYKVTSEECPFHTNPKANITQEINKAFRRKGLWTGVYYSKPDWYHKDFWDPRWPPFDRNVNYDPHKYPEKWDRFVDFTHKQIAELMTDYGKVDILWVDGNWVRKQGYEEIKWAYMNPVESGFKKDRAVDQDIKADSMYNMARELQPGLLVVDRGSAGINENYLTYEMNIPEEKITQPYEVCMPTGTAWSWTDNHLIMPTHIAIESLIKIVAGGGNLLLNIAPGPHGDFEEKAYQLLEEIGNWMDINGKAIYGTRAYSLKNIGNTYFTQSKDSSILNALVIQGKNGSIASTISIPINTQKKVKSIELLGVKNNVDFTLENDTIVIQNFSKEILPKIAYTYQVQFDQD